jgi:hypothetical protein
VYRVHLDRLPPANAASVIDLLNSSLSTNPDMHGVILARIGTSTGSQTLAANSETGAPRIVTDFAFTTLGSYGYPAGTSAPAAGTVRIPGGAGTDGSEVVENGPVLHTDDTVYLFVQDQPDSSIAGGSAPGRLVETSPANIAVLSGMTVTWLGSHVPQDVFQSALQAHPAA